MLAEDGRQALEMIRKDRLDLVLLDVMMPEMDGYQVLTNMKASSVTSFAIMPKVEIYFQ